MSEHVGGAAETGAAMDYSEHDKTYGGFLAMAKYGTIHIIALLIAMAVFFFTGAGAIVSFLTFVVLAAGISYLMR
ncbi:aa3 type cytochrome c oxidase subunit IV [Hoeflea marina]|uniref:Aa3 type cytochrome c oxidase subunit IV n=1 Tax=Hoeflea marina TaxID=274592 RepID=A0A317PGZ7_9HYPH|nr:aa3-type cytochrome c oxidase subunit IV [Hoeflea marina]PWV97185.1 aa3 type cytochrome c oxidase subunit IV [Hoeflea marina]